MGWGNQNFSWYRSSVEGWKLHINFRLGEIRENKVLRRNRFLDLFIVMGTELRIYEGLGGAFNFIPWKARIVLILQ